MKAPYVAAFVMAGLSAPTPQKAFTPQEILEVQAAALRDIFRVETSPRFDVPSRVFLSVGEGEDPSRELLSLVADLPFIVQKRSACSKRKTVIGELCRVAAGETEVWLGTVTRLSENEAQLMVAVHTLSCPRRLRREAGAWRMLTAKEYVGVCRVA